MYRVNSLVFFKVPEKQVVDIAQSALSPISVVLDLLSLSEAGDEEFKDEDKEGMNLDQQILHNQSSNNVNLLLSYQKNIVCEE